MNERVYRRGHTRMRCPLRVCVGASNSLPEDESLAAFADRFLVRLFVEPIPDPLLENLLEGGWKLGRKSFAHRADIAEIDFLSEAAMTVRLDAVRPRLAQIIRTLRNNGIGITDRRAVKIQKLIAAAAVLDGRLEAEVGDLWTIIYAIPTGEQQALARDLLQELLSETGNATLPFAAEEASRGMQARAVRIANSAREILDNPPSPADETELTAWKLKLEGVAREIDAGFNSETVPEDLNEIRAAILAALESPVAEVSDNITV